MNRMLALTLCAFMLFGCTGDSTQNTLPASFSSDDGESSSGEPLFLEEEEAALIGESIIEGSEKWPEVDLENGSITDEYLALPDGRKVFRYFVDYDSDFLVLYDPLAQTIEPFFDLQAGFEDWTSVQVEQGPDDLLLILCGDQICRYDPGTKEMQSDYLRIQYPEAWADGALVAVQYDKAGERYVVAFTQWESWYLDQNHELLLAVFDRKCRETGRHDTGASVLRDSFVIWSVPFIRIEGDQVIFRTFTPEFAKQYPEFERAVAGLKATEEEKRQYAKLAQESYREYSYHLGTGVLEVIKKEDPFQSINWKLAKYADKTAPLPKADP